jgi:hypothetical protein
LVYEGDFGGGGPGQFHKAQGGVKAPEAAAEDADFMGALRHGGGL